MRSARTILFVTAIGVAASIMIARHRSIAWADTPHAASAEPAAAAAAVAPAEAMRRLQEGNERFVNQKMTAANHQDTSRRQEVAKGQHPFAVVLGCADSRVPPELIFDQGLGDLFVIRVAGEVASAEVTGSIEYAVEHLGCRTIIVLGHERCGAVEAALKAADGSLPEGDLGQLIKEIVPVTEKIDRKSPDALDAAVRANAKAVANTLVSRSKILGEMSHKGEIAITPARYDLDTGKVEFIEQPGSGGGSGSGGGAGGGGGAPEGGH